MRDPARLNNFYEKLKAYHRAYFPDLRFGQLINNFLSWAGTDGFYLEEDKFLEKFKEYIEAVGVTDDKPKVIFEGDDIVPAIIYIPKNCIGMEVTAKIYDGGKVEKAVSTMDTEAVHEARIQGDEYEDENAYYTLTDKAKEELGL